MASPLTLTDFGITQEELSLAATELLAQRRENELLLREPYLFHREVLCPPKLKSYLRPFHQEGLEWMNRKGGKRLKLILWPRGHLKSTIFTQGESVRHATMNPNIRILINSSKAEGVGEAFLTSIKGSLSSDSYTRRYGNVLPNTKSGKHFRNNQRELTFLTRTNVSLKEPTITISGLDATKTSQHYDLIFHDDLVMRENVGTFEMMDKVWQVWQDSMDLLEPDGTMVIIGTRWHPLDLYGRIISDYVDKRCFDGCITNHVANCSCHFDVSVLTLRNDDGTYIFDSKFDDNIAKQLLTIKTQREFSAQYENNPTNSETIWFKKEDIDASIIEPEEIEKMREHLVWYMLVDPAESTEKRASYTAIVAVGVDHETGHWYVDYAKQLKVDTAGFINAVFDAHYLMKPHRFAMEKKTRKALEYVLKDKMAQFNRFFSIEDLNPALGNTPNAKEIRIRSLRPMFEAGRIHINATLHDLLSILYTIPSSPTFDLPDVLSYTFQLVPQGLGAEGYSPSKPAIVTLNKGIQYAVRYHARQRSNVAGCGTRVESGTSLSFKRVHSSVRPLGRRKIR
jgi:hypothetical protein